MGEWICGVVGWGNEREKKKKRGERGMFDIVVIGVNFGVDVGVFSAVPTPSGFRDEDSTRPTCWNVKF